MNAKLVQVQGPFLTNQELVNLIDNTEFKYIKEIGISTKIKNYVKLDGETFEIGKTGILQIQNTHITSVQFSQDVGEETLVDFVLA